MKRKNESGKKVRIPGQSYINCAAYQKLTRIPVVIREIEEADLHWDPKVRKRKDRQGGRNEEEHASASREDEASMGTEPGKSNDGSSTFNVIESESTTRGFY